jgi:hypothetical protein
VNRRSNTSRISSSAMVAILTTVIFAFSVGSVLAEEPRVLGPGSAADSPRFQVLSKSSDALELECTLPSVLVEDLDTGSGTFQLLTIPGGGEAGEVGEPMLPTFSRFISLPDEADARVSVTVEESEELSGFHVLPMQSEDASEFSFNATAYARSGYGSSPAATVGSPSLIRGLRVVPLSIAPVEYDPAAGTVRVARRLHVSVTYHGEYPINARSAGPPRSITRSFDALYRALVLDYDGPPQGAAVENGCWLLISPDNAGVTSRLQPLVNWRTRQGLSARMVTTAETGTTKELIKAYIQNAYDTWPVPPEYIVLAGDASGSYSLPTWYENVSGQNGEGDHPYGQLDGTDILLDAHVGRLSFSTLTELEVIVAKTVGYESTPYVSDPNWFGRACLVGDPIDSGISTIMVQQWIKIRLRELGYTQIDTVFNSPFVSQMNTALNRGDTIFCYRGIQGMSGWTNTYTAGLTNTNKLHFAVISTCGTGSFAGGTARSEVFLRTGTVTSPKAAIGAIGTATTGTHTRFNNCLTYGVFQGLLYENMWEMGATLTRGKYELYLNYQSSGPNYVIQFSYWNNLMGDPACRVWTGFPSPLTVNYPGSIPVGTNSVQVSVLEQGGRACAGAQVCLWKGSETYVVGTTDAQGQCELAVSTPTSGPIQLTVSKHDRAPLLANINVAASDVYVGYQNSVIDDDSNGASQGNGDATVNPGETIELRVDLQNFGSQSAPAVGALLTTEDPYVTIQIPTASFGNITPGSEAWSVIPFVFSVSKACPHGHVLRFGLQITSGANQWNSIVDLTDISADLNATDVTLYNSGNGRLDPGETLEISVTLHNEGGAAANVTTALLTSLSPWVRVLDPSGSYGTIGVDASIDNILDHFQVSADPGTYGGHLALLRLVTLFNGGATDTTYATVAVGQCTSVDPVGPDRYGYLAFDDTDTSYPEAPVYQWVEIGTNHGGDGTQVQLGDYGEYQDKSRAVTLPFAFKFYGQTFTRATVCSNGWIAMGDTYLTDYRNWSIPGAGAPSNLIAVFWDDLYETSSGGGHVYQKYDAANHRWIVEWTDMLNGAYGSYIETFEVFLYDPAYVQTTTGDGVIVMQYKQVANVDYTDGYCTVGVQNEDHEDGLCYTYFNRYPAGAAPLAANRAIKFLPVVIDVAAAPAQSAPPRALTLAPNRENPFRSETEISFFLAQEGPARLTIYDVQGRAIRRLADGALPSGSHTLIWTGNDDRGRPVPAGVYFYRLDAEGRSLVRKMMKLD